MAFRCPFASTCSRACWWSTGVVALGSLSRSGRWAGKNWPVGQRGGEIDRGFRRGTELDLGEDEGMVERSERGLFSIPIAARGYCTY